MASTPTASTPTVVLVEQVFLALALGQRRGQFGRHVGRGDLGRQWE
jgi:hypothetical protein